MATRACTCVVSLLIPLFASGCIFDILGGIVAGGDKKSPQPVATAADPKAGPPVLVPVGSPPVIPEPRQMDASARSQKSRTSSPPAVLKLDESAVKWSDPSEFHLGNPAPSHPQPAPERQAAVTPQRPIAVRAPAGADSEPDAAEAAAEPAAAALPSDDAVANEGLQVNPAAAQAAADVSPVASAPGIPAASAAVPAKAIDGGELGARVARNLRESPGDLVANLDNQILRFLADEPAPDLNSIANLPAEDRELIVALIDGLTNFRNGLRSEQNPLLSQKIRPLMDLAGRLRSQAELTIPTIALCDAVKGFGMYEPVDGRFVGGRANETIVYCEVGNASSQQNDKGDWESKLSQEAILYKENGQRVWSNPRHAISDKSRNRRHDFFVAQKLTLPANLSTDRYILKVIVMDEQVKRVAEATMPVEIVASINPQQLLQPQQPPAPPAKPTASKAPLEPTAATARMASERQRAETPRRVSETSNVDSK